MVAKSLPSTDMISRLALVISQARRMSKPLCFLRARIWWLVATLGLLAGCSASKAKPVVDARLTAATSRSVLVFVPGITGSKLREQATGVVVWGEGRNLIKPKDGGYALARSIVDDASTRLEAFDIVEEMRLAWVRKPVYGPVRALFEANGYRSGDLEAPTAEATFYAFPYDWRQDNVVSAQALFARLERVRQARGGGPLDVDFVCQSNGAHICRYLIKYGDASLDDVEAGAATVPTELSVGRVVFVGTANGGSIRILREIDRGRRYVPWVGRYLNPETLFTFPSLYQDLPAYRDDLFLDVAGRPLAVDLYDPASWQRYGWSVFRSDVAARLAGAGREDLFGSVADRVAFLTRSLARARRFQAALARDVDGFKPPRYYQIQNRWKPTPERALLVARGSGWKTLFVGDRGVRSAALVSAASAEGDGHAAVASQRWLSPQEMRALADPMPPGAFYIDGEHFEMILEPETHQRLLEILRP